MTGVLRSVVDVAVPVLFLSIPVTGIFLFRRWSSGAARDGRDEQSIRAVLSSRGMEVEGIERCSSLSRLSLGGAFQLSTSVRIYRVSARQPTGSVTPVYVSIDPFGHLIGDGSRVRVKAGGAWVD